MSEEIKINRNDIVACNFWKACDYYKQLKRLKKENKKLKRIIEEKDKKQWTLPSSYIFKTYSDEVNFPHHMEIDLNFLKEEENE